MTPDDLADVARLRQGLYRFYAGALLPPHTDRIAALRAGAVLIDELGIEAFSFAPEWRQLRAELDAVPRVDALAGEHVRLFQSTAGRALCPPVESYYLGAARQAAAATTAMAVEAIYRRHGLRFDPGQAHLADEAAPQLELMAYLCSVEAAAREHDDAARAVRAVGDQLAFLDGHLVRWFPEFAARVSAAAGPGFYGALADAAVAFVGHDRELAAGLAAAPIPS